MTASDVILTKVVPGFGVLLANIMFFSILPALLKARKDRDLGELNPVPYAAILVNCIGWVIYSVLLVDYFIFFGNAPGILLGLFYTLTGAFYGNNEIHRRRIEATLIILIAVLMAASFLIIFDHGVSNDTHDQLLLGSAAVFNLIIFYASPLSDIATVVKTRNASTIYAPLALVSIMNGSLWTTYGFFIQDYFVLGPNAFGTLTGILQLFLRFRYKSSTPKTEPMAPAIPNMHQQIREKRRSSPDTYLDYQHQSSIRSDSPLNGDANSQYHHHQGLYDMGGGMNKDGVSISFSSQAQEIDVSTPAAPMGGKAINQVPGALPDRDIDNAVKGQGDFIDRAIET